jgi:hypothetical protein
MMKSTNVDRIKENPYRETRPASSLSAVVSIAYIRVSTLSISDQPWEELKLNDPVIEKIIMPGWQRQPTLSTALV